MYDVLKELNFDCGKVEETLSMTNGEKLPSWTTLVSATRRINFDLSFINKP